MNRIQLYVWNMVADNCTNLGRRHEILCWITGVNIYKAAKGR